MRLFWWNAPVVEAALALLLSWSGCSLSGLSGAVLAAVAVMVFSRGGAVW
jgi:hypothetical protein